LTNYTSAVLSLAYSADGSTLAAGDAKGLVKLWNVASETSLDIYPSQTPITMSSHPVALSGDATALAFNTPEQSLKLWLTNNPPQVETISAYNYFARSVSFSPDGRLLATAGSGERVHVFRTADGAPDPFLEDVSPTIGRVVAFSPDGALLAGGDNSGQISLWRVSDGQLVRQIPAHTPTAESIVALAFSPDSTLIASGGADAVAKIWHVADGSPQQSLSGHGGSIYALAFSPKGDLLVSGSGDTTLKLWRVADGNLNYTLTNHTDLVVGAAFSPDGTTIASGSFDGTARLWNAANGSNILTLQDGLAVRGVAYASDGDHLFTAGAGFFPGLLGTLRIWHLPDGTNVQTFSRELAYPTTLRVSSDQRFIAYGRYDGTIVLAKNPLAPPLGPQLSLLRSPTQWLLQVAGISGTNLTVQTSSNLVDWSDANQFPNPSSNLDVPITLGGSSLFYRALQR
jgi:WD40 repeat protein